MSLFSACNPLHEYEQFEGITYVAPVGNPPADTLDWSPIDPNRLLVTGAEVGFQKVQVYILDMETGQRNILMESETGSIHGDSWSPDGRYISLSVAPDTSGYEDGGLWLWDTEQNQLEIIFNDEVYFANWSPDGNELAIYTVTQKTDNAPRMITLSLIDVDTKEEEVIFTGDADERIFGLSWSPDGQQIVFSLGTSASEDSNLYLLDVNTYQLIQLTSENNNIYPEWAPIGDLIMYHKYWFPGGAHAHDIFLVNTTSSCEVKIPYYLPIVFGTTWSPDGEKIAFVGRDGIYTLELEIAFGEEFLSDEFPCQ
jgi:Tol biopolymer transport system component